MGQTSPRSNNVDNEPDLIRNWIIESKCYKSEWA